MMERIWELKEVCVNSPCFLNFDSVAGFSALFSTHEEYAEIKEKKITWLNTAADQLGKSNQDLLIIQESSLVTNSNQSGQPQCNKYRCEAKQWWKPKLQSSKYRLGSFSAGFVSEVIVTQ